MPSNKLLCTSILFFFSMVPAGFSQASIAHPTWSNRSNIYEVNVRQYTKAGTFKAFATSLPRLRKMGVDILWFMPINPISKIDRKGTLGSYYAVQDYTAINPEYGNMNDWKALVTNAHALGFKVIIDWVPNHSGADHPWLKSHPDFYVHDSTGKATYAYDWSDTRKLNYKNPELRDSMIAAMKFWILNSGIDGFRCDVAGDVPSDFWKTCISSLRKIKYVFMLAEADKAELHTVGFDATYPWSVEAVLFNMYSGKAGIPQLDSVLAVNEKSFPANAFRMYYTTNHDENSWNGTEYERMGEGSAAFAVFSQTMFHSIPCIYSGQESANKKRIQFFEKDSIAWDHYRLQAFYHTLLDLRKRNTALSADATFRKLKTNADQDLYVYVREKAGSKVLVMLNFSGNRHEFELSDPGIRGKGKNVFTSKVITIGEGTSFVLPAWGYMVFEVPGAIK